MQKDFHFFAVFALAVLAGFQETGAGIIAYASQYVDDSTESEPVRLPKDQRFDTVRTAHYDLESFDWNVQKKIFMPFHFLPGPVRRFSPETFTYRTQTATGHPSQMATMLFDDAVREQDGRFRLVRIGVALHTIADTFSHHGFSGRQSSENDVDEIWEADAGGNMELKIFDSYVADLFLPPIGHAEALNMPDIPYLLWRYSDGTGKKTTLDNVSKAVAGAERIYAFLKRALNEDNGQYSLSQDHPADYFRIGQLFKTRGKLADRCGAWQNAFSTPDYDRTLWRADALKGDVRWDDMDRPEMKNHLMSLKGRKKFDDSLWALFHRAAHRQRCLVTDWLN